MVTLDRYWVTDCEPNLLFGRFSSTDPEFLSISSL